jgi:FlaG/FlaF family flagellin (archaellin)
MLRRLMVTATVVLASTFGALAGSNHDHDHGASHGGVLAETSGHHHLELVAADGSLQVYVTHTDGKPQDVKDAKAAATVLSQGKTERVELMPKRDNLFAGAGNFTAGAGTVVVITLTLPDHKPEQARFELK